MPFLKRSIVWNYFNRLGGDEKSAECKYCSKVLSFKGGNSFNLTRHLKIKHKKEFSLISSGARASSPRSDYQERDEAAAAASVISKQQNLAGNSWIWQFYKRNETQDRAACVLCEEEYACEDTSGLLRHLDMEHPTQQLETAADSGEDFQHSDSEYQPSHDEAESDVEPVIGCDNSYVWRELFTYVDDVLACCKLCGQRLSCKNNKTFNLKRHWLLKHKGDTSPVKAPADSSKSRKRKPDLDIEYFPDDAAEHADSSEELEGSREEQERSGEAYKSQSGYPVTIFAPQETVSIEDPIGGDEVDLFGRYVMCVMRRLPRLKCCRLQREILNIVMKAQIDHETSIAKSS